MKLKLANDLSLPPDAITQTFLIVGKRGSGKSNTAARLVEQFHRAGLPFVVLDPVDTWWGLKASRDGRDQGLDVYVFGGRKQDLPLNAGDGALIAEVLCEHRISMVLSVKHLSGRERNGFMVKFAQTLFQKWGGGPLHVVLEEAHELAPQMGGRATGNEDNEAAMLGAFKRLWKLGRASGIGGSAITQRPASLSKDITTQSEILIAHRTIGPQDVKAIGEWVKYHGEHADLLAELPSLPTGDAFVWAPEFPEGKPLGLVRKAILLRETYDSASTPKVGEQRVEPKELAPADLEKLRTKMSATIEKAKSEDPKELRRQLVAAKAELAQKDRALQQIDAKTKTIEDKLTRVSDQHAARTDGEQTKELKQELARYRRALEAAMKIVIKIKALDFPVETEEDRKALEQAVAAAVRQVTGPIEKRVTALASRVEGIRTAASDAEKAIAALLDEKVDLTVQVQHREPFAVTPEPTRRPAAVPSSNGNGAADPSIGKSGLRRMLIALAQRPQGLTRGQLGLRAQVSSKGGSFDTYLSKARVSGWVNSEGDRIRITDAGVTALGSYDPLPEGRALLEYYVREFGSSGAARMLTALADAYPRALSRQELSEQSNVSAAGGSFDTYLSKLRTLELVEGKAELRASEELFS